MTYRTARSAARRALPLIALAALGAGSAALVRKRVAQAEAAHPPIGRFVHIDGARLHLVEMGSGPETLVLLHGNSSMGEDFLVSGLARMAAARYRVIVVDRPGYGYSTRPRRAHGWGPEAQAHLIHGALKQVGVENAIVLGHSWGAMVAAALALDFPQTVRGLVLEAGYFYPRPRSDILMRAPNAVPGLGDLLRHTISPLIHVAAWPLMARMIFAPAPVPRNAWRLSPWLLFHPRALGAASAEMAGILAGAARLAPRYPLIRQPTVIIAGRQDAFVNTAQHSARLAEVLPQAEFRCFDGIGHMAHHLIPEEVLAAIDMLAVQEQ
ncbi:alpha/beta fold hydrolase [Halodurantibacterium flavum]|uniref:Alpha/beta fold hydrolase n=1 Tax=Halodurantibacterium flavum TaxID=1382802 RepID=A0ABW4S5W9_9RHOB